MPTKFMKLGFDEQVLRGLTNEDDGYVLNQIGRASCRERV